MLTVNAVLLGVSYLEDQEQDIRKYLPFMTNASYATFALVSACAASSAAVSQDAVPGPGSYRLVPRPCPTW